MSPNNLRIPTLALSLLALTVAGCDLESVQVGGGFRENDEDGSSEAVSEDDGADDPADDGDGGQADDGGADEPPPADDGGADEPPPTDEPPPGDEAISLSEAFEGCLFNAVWTKNDALGFNQGGSLLSGQLTTEDADTLAFTFEYGNLAFVFPGIESGVSSVLTLEQLGIDEATGDLIIGATVSNERQILELPPLQLDASVPAVIIDGEVQYPRTFGQATLTSLVDGSQTTYELGWDLPVFLDGELRETCVPFLEPFYPGVQATEDLPEEEPEPLPEPGPAPEPLVGITTLDEGFDSCLFDAVWTKNDALGLNQGGSLLSGQLTTEDADTLAFSFESSDLAWVFPGIEGGVGSVLTLELLGVDAATGDLIIGGTVSNELQVLELPPLQLDASLPLVLTDATVQDPRTFGQATLTSLVDGSQTTYELGWDLPVFLGGEIREACVPFLQQYYPGI